MTEMEPTREHTPVTERDRLGHPWNRCTTCGALSSFWPLTTGCLGPRSSRPITEAKDRTNPA